MKMGVLNFEERNKKQIKFSSKYQVPQKNNYIFKKIVVMGEN